MPYVAQLASNMLQKVGQTCSYRLNARLTNNVKEMKKMKHTLKHFKERKSNNLQ